MTKVSPHSRKGKHKGVNSILLGKWDSMETILEIVYYKPFRLEESNPFILAL